MNEADFPCTTTAPTRSDANRARGAAFRLLALRPRTVAEMREKLERRFGAQLAEETVRRLESDGLLNDAAFAQQWRDSRDRRRPRGRKLIAKELKQRGVPDDAIESALDNFDPGDAAWRAATRYAARQAGCDRITFDRKVGAFLERRGFEYGTIRETLRQLRTELGIAANPGRNYPEDQA